MLKIYLLIHNNCNEQKGYLIEDNWKKSNKLLPDWQFK